MVAIIMLLNKDLFFICRFDVIAASMIMDVAVAVAVDVVGRERGWALCVKVEVFWIWTDQTSSRWCSDCFAEELLVLPFHYSYSLHVAARYCCHLWC